MSIREGMEIRKLQKRADALESLCNQLAEELKEIKERLSRRGRPPKSEYAEFQAPGQD